MISKSMTVIENAYAAAPMLLFPEFDAKGNLDYSKTRGVLSVYCNKKRGDDNYDDKFEIWIKGEGNLTTIATHVGKGKGFDRLNCFASVQKKGAIKVDENGEPMKKNGQWVYEDSIRLHLQSVELGNDSVSVQKENGMAALRAKRAQGTIRPDLTDTELEVIVDGYNQGRSDKPKNTPFNLVTAQTTGKWGNASLWSKDRGHWAPNAQAGQQTQQAPTGGPSMTPEELAEFYEFKRAQAAARAAQNAGQQTASAGETGGAPNPGPAHTGEGSVWSEVPF